MITKTANSLPDTPLAIQFYYLLSYHCCYINREFSRELYYGLFHINIKTIYYCAFYILFLAMNYQAGVDPVAYEGNSSKIMFHEGNY